MDDATTQDRETLILERILSLKQILRDGGGGPLELHELGICYYHLANYRQAAGFLGQLVEQYPDYLEIGAVHSLRILCFIYSGEYREARRTLEERLKLFPGDTRLLGMLAHIQEAEGEYRRAIETHRRILALEPENSNSLNNAGYLMTLHGTPEEKQEAWKFLRKAVEKKPTHPAYLDSFGVFLGRSGQKENARKALEKALRRVPDNATILGHLKELENRRPEVP